MLPTQCHLFARRSNNFDQTFISGVIINLRESGAKRVLFADGLVMHGASNNCRSQVPTLVVVALVVMPSHKLHAKLPEGRTPTNTRSLLDLGAKSCSFRAIWLGRITGLVGASVRPAGCC